MLTRRSPDIFSGRWNTGMVASTFPDLNFRIAELLSDLHMPAALLAPVLAAATLDFVNSTISRDQDDRRGLMEFVQTLQADRVEQYLALLTTDGPLVPIGESPTGKGDNRHLHLTRGLDEDSRRSRSSGMRIRDRGQRRPTGHSADHLARRDAAISGPTADRDRDEPASTLASVQTVTFSVDGREAARGEAALRLCVGPGRRGSRPSRARRRDAQRRAAV